MISFGSYPSLRLRRNRQTPWYRDLVAENFLCPKDLIWPLFVREESSSPHIDSLPGVTRLTIQELLKAGEMAVACGFSAIALFPVVLQELKNKEGLEAINPQNLLCRAIQAIKAEFPELGIITDVALDAYTSHGHDGILQGTQILNDETLEVLAKAAIAQAEAGADILAPSDMMDGRVGYIRQALDSAGFQQKSILSYTAKYASAFYHPFREALGSASALGKADKKTYQMDPRNSDEALRESWQDIQEGADMLLVKPAIPYLDILYRVKEAFRMPTFVYHVSGEYAMLKAASLKGWLDYDKALLEIMISCKRAGADGIFTYAAPDVIKALDAI